MKNTKHITAIWVGLLAIIVWLTIKLHQEATAHLTWERRASNLLQQVNDEWDDNDDTCLTNIKEKNEIHISTKR